MASKFTLDQMVYANTNGIIPLRGGSTINADGSFDTGAGTKFIMDTGTITATGATTAGAATSNHQIVLVTTASLTTSSTTYTLTLTNSTILATSIVDFTVWNGTNTTAWTTKVAPTVSAGSVAIPVLAGGSLNGTLIILVKVLS